MTTASPSTTPKHLIGSSVDEQLLSVADGLASGRIELSDCSAGIIALYALGETLSPNGERIRQLERDLAQARRDADRYYLAAFNPAERAEHIRNRMDAALDALPPGIFADTAQGVELQLRAAMNLRSNF